MKSKIVYSGLITAARLKALGIESIVLDRHARVGDSWAHRYDCLKVHVPTSNCEMPYTCKLLLHLQSDYLLANLA